ncbi:MAG TPA: glycerophosphodiester phosphodiesterase family protein [Candidatus Hydrogenedentes bacterium]|nr:glycerophosphodiester phosphodiesterase family protein [Candidatus Hydrogenedentota bacterium]HPG69419.1 glycerophosphodiester phosphodiesterase family protein [Candidatus Hydrogenedentota bacterium]
MTMLPITVPDRFRIIAHRGASGYAPENTLAAFQLALDMAVREIELDTQLSSDGHVMLCHDKTLARYGHGDRGVRDMTVAQLDELDMGSWFSPFLCGGERMATLDHVFARYRRKFTYHVELKSDQPALPRAVADLIAKHDLADCCIVTAFAYDALAAMKSVAPELRRAWLVNTIDAEALSGAERLGAFHLCPRASDLTAAGVRDAKDVVPEVRAFGLSDIRAEALEGVQRVLDTGCDGVTINQPDWLIHAGDAARRRERGRRSADGRRHRQGDSP